MCINVDGAKLSVDIGLRRNNSFPCFSFVILLISDVSFISFIYQYDIKKLFKGPKLILLCMWWKCYKKKTAEHNWFIYNGIVYLLWCESCRQGKEMSTVCYACWTLTAIDSRWNKIPSICYSNCKERVS